MPRGTPASREEGLAAELRLLLRSMKASGRAFRPDSSDELLQTIVEAAARLFGAAASSIALLDEAQGTLQFRVATGAGAEEVVGMSIPVGEGIAGYVVMTGQPLAVSSVQDDPRFARETARKTGYVPRSILAMPLLYGERPIGVIEVLDKIEAASFGMQDMELLGIFARQAAVAIRASLHRQHLDEALLLGLQRLLEGEGGADESALKQALEGADEDAEGAAQILALADIFGDLSRVGPAERRACLQILSAFAEYARSRPRFGG